MSEQQLWPQRSPAGRGADEGIAALDPANGLPYNWNPGRKRGYGVSAFLLTEDGLWIGSDTDTFGGERRGRIAFCRIDTGKTLPPYTVGTLPGTLVLLGEGTTSDVSRRTFNGTIVGTATPIVSTQEWQNVRGSFVVGGVLYTGWMKGTFRAQAFDGVTLGPSTPVDLRGAFPELGTVRAMFFDRVTRRIYYTLRGSAILYYRYFQPQSRVVGSWQYEVDAPSQLDWGTVRGGFIVTGTMQTRLFFTSSDGTLQSVTWAPQPGTTVGPPTTLLGPGIDGNDYRAAGLVFTG